MRKVMLVGMVLVAACGDGEQVTVDARAADAAPDATIDAPPSSCASGAKTIFLDRAGGLYVGGTADDATTNTTKVLGTDTFNVPAFPHGDTTWNDIKTCVTAALAPYGVVVTDVDPGTAVHHEIVFTTSYAAWPNGNPNYGSLSSTNCRGRG
jgi:hypothetical protein